MAETADIIFVGMGLAARRWPNDWRKLVRVIGTR